MVKSLGREKAVDNYEKEIRERHSVRDYDDLALTQWQIDALNKLIKEINKETGLEFSLHTHEDIFSHWILGYGIIKNCKNYLRFAGKSSESLLEKVGYYGEMLILKAQRLGLNTCWVGGTYRKKDVLGDSSSTLVCVAALGVGKTEGTQSKSKPLSSYYEGENVPEWFLKGMEAVSLAPSAVNQKKWMFKYLGGKWVEAESHGKHFNEVDLGIAKLHFELGSGKKVFGFPSIKGF